MRFKTMLVVSLLALWVLATNHCRIEHLPALSLLSCGEHSSEAQDPGHGDCEGDSCASVENQLYKTETSRVLVAAPTLAPTPAFLSPVLTVLSVPPMVRPLPPDAPPSMLPRAWQFSRRAALPPRAPSFL